MLRNMIAGFLCLLLPTAAQALRYEPADGPYYLIGEPGEYCDFVAGDGTGCYTPPPILTLPFYRWFVEIDQSKLPAPLANAELDVFFPRSREAARFELRTPTAIFTGTSQDAFESPIELRRAYGDLRMSFGSNGKVTSVYADFLGDPDYLLHFFNVPGRPDKTIFGDYYTNSFGQSVRYSSDRSEAGIIPLPASGLVLLGALAGLGAVSRRRRA